MTQSTYLIVDQQQPAPVNLAELLKELVQRFQLDSYQCRQRLVGRGISLLSQGQPEQLAEVSALLQDYQYANWLVEPTRPKFVPPRIRSLAISSTQLSFTCQKKLVVFPQGAAVLAVMGEMSGALIEKSIGQLLASNAYRGKDDLRQLTAAKTQKIILQGQPVLDLYLLDDQLQVSDAVRVFPGKFDPNGLGQRATVSSVQNLVQVLQLAEENAGGFSLVTDFGLVNLPGCNLRRENLPDPETERQNLISLARYGWLLADLARAKARLPQAQSETDELSGVIATALLGQNPALAGSGQVEAVLPLAQEIARELGETKDPQTKETASPAETADPGLPAPPQAIKVNRWNSVNFWLGSAGALVVLALSLLLEFDSQRLLVRLLRQAFASGAIQILLAGVLFWFGFYFIRLKRQVENTPTSKIRSIAMGMVEVKGQALRQYALVSPMSQVPCVYYRLTRYRRGKNNQWRVSSISSSDAVPFLLEDETGRIEIDPAGCRVSAGTRQEGSPGLAGLSRFAGDDNEKWVEEIIVEGTLLYILGFARVKTVSAPSVTERKITALKRLKQDPQAMRQVDLDGDGKISETEWERARTGVEEQVLREELRLNQQRKKQEEHIVIGKTTGRPLIIAETHSEDQLTRRYALYTIPLFGAAAAATAWGIIALLSYLK